MIRRSKHGGTVSRGRYHLPTSPGGHNPLAGGNNARGGHTFRTYMDFVTASRWSQGLRWSQFKSLNCNPYDHCYHPYLHMGVKEKEGMPCKYGN